ncbi:hypothetical protein [Bradyrhizobium sp. UFLA05-112]
MKWEADIRAYQVNCSTYSNQRSNRRVPSELLGGLDGDEPARSFIREQDREIAEKSGCPPLEIERIERVGAKKK